ncbi:MAG: Crp/Fnr family transcriptional regulator [Schleiferiaceae bacterium]|nr:Crp/Fnr family transcriptional regulator [Schleiferiaceae bacterium]
MSQSSYFIREAFDSLLTENQRALMQLFERDGEYITVAEGQVYHFNNQSKPGFVWILSGAAKEMADTNQCYHIFIAGDFIGLEEMLSQKPLGHSLQFVSTVNHILFVPETAFLKVQRTNPGIATPLIRKIHMDVTNLEDRAISICQTSTSKRLEQLFKNLQLRWGKHAEDWVPLKVSMEDLAQMVGASRNTILRIIKTQREQGMLEFEEDRFRWLGQLDTVS